MFARQARIPAEPVERAHFAKDQERLRKIGTAKIYTIPETAPGQRTSRTFRLPVGSYKVWCGIADHRAMGMRAPLKVSAVSG